MTTPHVGPGPGPGRVETFTPNLPLGPLAGRAPHVHDLDTEDNVLSVAPKKKRKLFRRRRKPRVRWTRGASRRPARRGPGELRATLTGLPRPGLDAHLSSALSPWSPSALGAQAGSDSRSHCQAWPVPSPLWLRFPRPCRCPLHSNTPTVTAVGHFRLTHSPLPGNSGGRVLCLPSGSDGGSFLLRADTARSPAPICPRDRRSAATSPATSFPK